MKRAPVLLLLLLLGGCAYYNGMYNTKRLAGRARRAEREGRTFDATSLWGQVGVKAESVLAHHPRSKWAEEARLLQGTSLVKLNSCARAVGPLGQVLTNSSDVRLTEEAALLLGRCRTTMGDPEGAMAAYGRLTNSKDPDRRRLALFSHGRAQRIAGNYESALSELNGTDYPGALGERAAALAGLGRLPEASVRVDSLLAAGDTTAPWDSLLAAVGRYDRTAATGLTDRIVETEGFPASIRARLLFADGLRWRDSDTARAAARMKEGERAALGTPLSRELRFENLHLEMREVSTPDELERVMEAMDELTEGPGTVGPRAAQLVSFGRAVLQAADSVPAGSPNGDLRLFLAGEMARDSLAAPRFARQQFRRVATEWPASPFAPKAVLALILLEPGKGDSLRSALLASYPSSPYVEMIEGGSSPEFAALEDSLRRYAMTLNTGSRPLPTRTQPRPGTPGVQVDQ